MDTKSKLLFSVFFIVIVLSTAASYLRFVVNKDYLMSVEVPCDPSVDSCYFYEDEETGEPILFKLIERPAHDLPNCDPSDTVCMESIYCTNSPEEVCEVITCGEGEDCWVAYN